MSKKQKTGFRWTIARRIVQIAVLVLFTLPMLVAGWGLFGHFSTVKDAGSAPASLPFFGTLSSSQIGPITVMDPFATLQIAAAVKDFPLEWLWGILPVIVVYGLIRGRAFCGWVCPVNLLMEGVDWLRKKLHLQVLEAPVPRRTKMVLVLVVIVLSAITCVPVFEMISPLSAINKGLVLGSTVGVITLLAIVVAELLFGHRVWCRSICPLGGFYQALGKIGLVNVKIDHDACIACDKCKQACLCDPVILDPVVGEGAEKRVVSAGDCMLCGKCVDACPTGCLKISVGKK